MSTTDGARAASDRGSGDVRTSSGSTTVRVHTPYRRGLPNLGVYLRDLWSRRQFAVEMARTQIRSQHLNTTLGQLWMVLNPLLLSLVYFLVVVILRGGATSVYGDYLEHLMAGLFLYYYLQSCISAGAGSIVSSGRLILNTAFPKALLPLSAVLVAMFRFLPTIAVFLALRLVKGDGLSLSMLWAFPIFVMITVYGIGAAMLFATLNLYFRDVASFLPYVLRIWLYVSPILYFPEEFLKRVPDHLEPIVIVANPLFTPLATWSEAMVQNEGPPLSHMLIGTGWALLFLLLGAWVFLSREREFAVRL